MIKIVAKRYLKEGVFDEYVALVKPLVDQTQSEPGCVEYALYTDRAQNLVAMMETWVNQEYLDDHMMLIRASGYPEKMQSYADPARPTVIEKYELVYQKGAKK